MPDHTFGSIPTTGGSHDAWLDLAETGEMSDEAAEALEHVLHAFHVPNTAPGGGFTASLLDTIAHSDHDNRTKLGAAFPAHVGFYAACSHYPGAVHRLIAALHTHHTEGRN